MEKHVQMLQHAHQAKDVSLAIRIPIIDFVIQEKFDVPIGEKEVPLSSWFQASKKRKKTQIQAYYPMSRILFKRPGIILLQYFKTRGQVFSNQGRLMRIIKSQKKNKIKYQNI
jgi:hypothetical protein